jgi:hypothetical protein
VSKTTYPPIESVTRSHVGTSECAQYLGRAQSTLHKWHCLGTGPMQPRVINGRLAWPVADLKKLLGVNA